MKTYEFWRERATGELCAVELLDGVVVGFCGPLDQEELEEGFLPTFDYVRGQAQWVERHRDAFDLVDLTRV